MKSILKRIAALSILALMISGDASAMRRGGGGRGFGGGGRRGGFGLWIGGGGRGWGAGRWGGGGWGRPWYGRRVVYPSTYVVPSTTTQYVPVATSSSTDSALARRLAKLEQRLEDLLDAMKEQGATAEAEARLEKLQRQIEKLSGAMKAQA